MGRLGGHANNYRYIDILCDQAESRIGEVDCLIDAGLAHLGQSVGAEPAWVYASRSLTGGLLLSAGCIHLACPCNAI